MKKILLVLVAVSMVFIFVGTASADLTTGLVAYYPFNGNANDESGNGNDGTIQGGGGVFTTDRFGRPNGALELDGIDDYVLVANESNFDLTEFTIIAVIKVPNYSKDNWIISKGFYFGNYTLRVDDDQGYWPGYASYVHQIATGNWSSLVSNNSVPVNEFFQIAVTVSAAEFNSYINGALEQGPISSPPPPVLNDEQVTIGAGGYDSITDFFVGIIDDIRIYNRVLSASEIQELYATLTISPPTGVFVTTQSFDLTLIVEASGLSIVGGSAILDASDVTAGLVSCVIPGTLISGGRTFRCPGLTGGFLGTGIHTLDVTLDLSDGTSVSDTVTWEVKENTEQ